MYAMSSDDFSVHQQDCDEVESGIPITSLSDEVTLLDDLPCFYWDEVDSFDELD